MFPVGGTVALRGGIYPLNSHETHLHLNNKQNPGCLGYLGDYTYPVICAIGSINSHYFHIIGDKLINPIGGIYIYPLEGFPIKDGMTIPNIGSLDPGTYRDYFINHEIRIPIKQPA